MSKYKVSPDYRKETKKYIQSVIKKLNSDDGELDDVWFASLDLIASNYNTILDCQEKIKTDGIMITNRFGDKIAHPLIKVSENASIQLQKLLIEFLLTKKSALKTEPSTESTSSDDSPLMQFFNNKLEKRNG